MKSRTHIIITIVNCIILLFLVVFLVFFYSDQQNKNDIVYVDNVLLYSGFNMTKDLDKINTKKINGQKKKLDSLYTIYQIFKQNNAEDKYGKIEAELRTEDQELKKMNERISNEISQKVWTRLNGYVKEYGEQNKYRIVMGTQGYGNVMYAEEVTDITNELLIYANKKYEGNK